MNLRTPMKLWLKYMYTIHQTETLINDERKLKCMNIVTNLLEIVIQRAGSLFVSKEPQTDMLRPLHTLIYASRKLDIEELNGFREWALKKYGKVFLMVSEKEPKSVYDEVYSNIDIYLPPVGEKVAKLIDIATKRGIPYTPIQGKIEYDQWKRLMEGGGVINSNPPINPYNKPVVYEQKPIQQIMPQPMYQPIQAPQYIPMQPQKGMNIAPAYNPVQMPMQNPNPNPSLNPNQYPSLASINIPKQTFMPPQQPQYTPQYQPNIMPPPNMPPHIDNKPQPPPMNISPSQPPNNVINPPQNNAQAPSDDILADLERQINDLKKD